SSAVFLLSRTALGQVGTHDASGALCPSCPSGKRPTRNTKRPITFSVVRVVRVVRVRDWRRCKSNGRVPSEMGDHATGRPAGGAATRRIGTCGGGSRFAPQARPGCCNPCRGRQTGSVRSLARRRGRPRNVLGGVESGGAKP